MKKSLIVALLLFALALPGCGGKTSPTPSPEAEKPTAAWAKGKELFALADSEEAAQAIADQYGIELVSFSDGVASFHTEEDPRAVVQRGAENGWTPVEVNILRKPMN